MPAHQHIEQIWSVGSQILAKIHRILIKGAQCDKGFKYSLRNCNCWYEWSFIFMLLILLIVECLWRFIRSSLRHLYYIISNTLYILPVTQNPLITGKWVCLIRPYNILNWLLEGQPILEESGNGFRERAESACMISLNVFSWALLFSAETVSFSVSHRKISCVLQNSYSFLRKTIPTPDRRTTAQLANNILPIERSHTALTSRLSIQLRYLKKISDMTLLLTSLACFLSFPVV